MDQSRRFVTEQKEIDKIASQMLAEAKRKLTGIRNVSEVTLDIPARLNDPFDVISLDEYLISMGLEYDVVLLTKKINGKKRVFEHRDFHRA